MGHVTSSVSITTLVRSSAGLILAGGICLLTTVSASAGSITIRPNTAPTGLGTDPTLNWVAYPVGTSQSTVLQRNLTVPTTPAQSAANAASYNTQFLCSSNGNWGMRYGLNDVADVKQGVHTAQINILGVARRESIFVTPDDAFVLNIYNGGTAIGANYVAPANVNDTENPNPNNMGKVDGDPNCTATNWGTTELAATGYRGYKKTYALSPIATPWSVTTVNGLEAYLGRQLNGTADWLRLDSAWVVLTYLDLMQSAYRIYTNADSTTPGAALAANNTPAVLSQSGDAFRARIAITPDADGWPASTGTYKLQVADKTTSCSAATGWADVQAGSGDIRWYDNPSVADNVAAPSLASDVTVSGSKVMETYRESSGFTDPTAIPSGSTGVWDFSLKDFSNKSGKTYCLRVVTNDNTPLTYTQYPEIRTQGELALDIVDGSGVSVATPSVTLGSLVVSTSCRQSTGTLGTASQKLRVKNTTASGGWSLSIAPTNGSTAKWSSGTNSYDVNDGSGTPAGCSDGDSDLVAGQLSLNPANGSITPTDGACISSSVQKKASSAFSSAVSSIELVSAGASAPTLCTWDITGITIAQQIPANIPQGNYTIDMTATVTAQ